MAKKMAPAIIFIDEIDAVGRSRGVGMGGGNDEREQTLNQILVEMDGFEPTDKVIVMAATNRSDVLDSALLRPGRFDRRVMLDLPDRRDRNEILKIHAKKKKIAEDVNIETIAARTPGFSGADLYSVMNEAAILAARHNRKELIQVDLTNAVEKVMIGPERQSHLMGDKEKRLTAYHEAGHALLASLLPHADPVHKVSIISRGNAGGYTMKIPLDDKRMHTKNSFLDDIVVSMGGYATEEIIIGDVTTGPSNDIQVATSMAREMVTKFGMSNDIGPIATLPANKVMFGESADGLISQNLQNRVDSEIEKIIKNSYEKAKKLLIENRNILDAIANKLIEVETLEQAEYNEIIESFDLKPKTL
jgi:cell division protease FtsH